VVVWGFAGGQRKKRREHLIIEAGHGEPLDGAGCEMDGLDLLPPGCSLSFSWRERRGARELEGARLVHFFLEKGLVTPPAGTRRGLHVIHIFQILFYFLFIFKIFPLLAKPTLKLDFMYIFFL
jgi:hypothetical protein